MTNIRFKDSTKRFDYVKKSTKTRKREKESERQREREMNKLHRPRDV